MFPWLLEKFLFLLHEAIKSQNVLQNLCKVKLKLRVDNLAIFASSMPPSYFPFTLSVNFDLLIHSKATPQK